MNCQILPMQRWSIAKRMFFRFDARLRRAHRLFRQFPLCPFETFMDVGACDGDFTDSILAYFQPRKVWVVEADSDQAAVLTKKYETDPRCEVVAAAIADQTGFLEFHINEHKPSSSLIPISDKAAEVFRKSMGQAKLIRVPAITLDDLFRRQGIERIDLMKVDIQGAERLLIQGGREALQKVHQVFMEVWFEECYRGAALFSEIQTMMTALGFKLRSFHEFRRGVDGNLVYTNALYVRNLH